MRLFKIASLVLLSSTFACVSKPASKSQTKDSRPVCIEEHFMELFYEGKELEEMMKKCGHTNTQNNEPEVEYFNGRLGFAFDHYKEIDEYVANEISISYESHGNLNLLAFSKLTGAIDNLEADANPQRIIDDLNKIYKKMRETFTLRSERQVVARHLAVCDSNSDRVALEFAKRGDGKGSKVDILVSKSSLSNPKTWSSPFIHENLTLEELDASQYGFFMGDIDPERFQNSSKILWSHNGKEYIYNEYEDRFGVRQKGDQFYTQFRCKNGFFTEDRNAKNYIIIN